MNTPATGSGGYVPGVDDPFLDPFGVPEDGTQSTHVDSGFPSEGEGFAESTCLTESTEFHLGSTAPTEFHSWGEAGERVAALLARLHRTDGKYPRWRVPFGVGWVLRGFPAQRPVELQGRGTPS